MVDPGLGHGADPDPGSGSASDRADRGVQNERTTLAWRRTNLAALTVAALAAKVSPEPALSVLVFGLAFGVCAAVGRGADQRARSRVGAIRDWDAGRSDAHATAAAPLAVAAATGLTVGLAAFGAMVAWFG